METSHVASKPKLVGVCVGGGGGGGGGGRGFKSRSELKFFKSFRLEATCEVSM